MKDNIPPLPDIPEDSPWYEVFKNKQLSEIVKDTYLTSLLYCLTPVLLRRIANTRDDIREHCEEWCWCMETGDCPTECPLRKYQEENDGIH